MKPLPGWYKGEKYDCDRCGFTYYKQELDQDPVHPNLLVCEKCQDKTLADRIYVEGGSI